MIVSENQEQELQREFDRFQFTDVVRNLLQSLNIIPVQPVDRIYDGLLRTKGKVVGHDVLEIVTMAQQDNQSNKINQEIKIFRGKINEKARVGITCLAIVEFEEVFGKEGIIIDYLKPYLQKLDYLSLDKLNKVLDRIEKSSETQGRLTKSLRISSLDKSDIFSEAQFRSELKVDSVIQYVQEKILDPAIKINLVSMLKNIGRIIYEKEQNQLLLQEVEASLRSNQQKIDDELYNTHKLLDSKQQEIQRLKCKIRNYEEQVTALNKRYQDDIVNNLEPLVVDNDKLFKSLSELTIKNEQVQAKLDWFQKNYEALAKQYQQFLREKEQTDTKDKKQKEERMFIQRTVKQQLEDAQGKISRLRSENGQLKNKNTDLLLIYENKIQALQERIKQLETQEASKLDFNTSGSKIRNSYLFSKSRISNSRETIRGSKMSELDQDVTQNKQSQLNRSSVEIWQNIVKEHCSTKDAFKKKSQINIQVDAAQIMTESDDEEEGNVFKPYVPEQKREKSNSIMQFFKPEDKTNKNKSFQVIQKPVTSKNKSFQVAEKPVSTPELPKNSKRVLTTSGYFLTAEGNRYPQYMIVTEDRFSFFDTKMRPNYSIKLIQLRKIIFCYHNTTWMVFKTKNKQKNEKNQTLTDTLFSVPNRQQILQFLHKRCAGKLYQTGVKISFQKQDGIWITGVQSQTLLSNYTNYYNIARISINNNQHIFEANIKSNSMFNMGSDVILIVTEIGILVFEQDGEFMLERSQKLQYLLPIVEFMEVKISGEQKLVLKYQIDKKVEYRIKTKMAADISKLKNAIQEFRLASIRNRQAEINKYSVLASVLIKSNP